MRRSAATSALGRSAAVRERRSLRGAAQRSSGADHVGLSFPEPTFSSRASLDFLSSSTRSESVAEGLSGKQKVTRRFLRCLSPQTHNAGFFFQNPGYFFGQNFRFEQRSPCSWRTRRFAVWTMSLSADFWRQSIRSHIRRRFERIHSTMV